MDPNLKLNQSVKRNCKHMEDTSTIRCKTCGHVGLADGLDGYYYCLQCGSQADDIMDTGVADEDFVDRGGDARGGVYQPIHTRRSQPVTPSQPLSQQDSRHSQFWSQITPDQPSIHGTHDTQSMQVKREKEIYDALGPSAPSDFGSEGNVEGALAYEDYYNEVRSRYVMGIQLMLQSQCEALVEKFNVTPLICGMVGPVWLRFMALSRVFADVWADEVIQDSEIQTQGEAQDTKRHIRTKGEPHNLYGQRAVTIWIKSLRKSIPLSCSLAICFLACHLAREAILPTDIVKWSLEGKIPYFAAFVDIGRQMGENSRACPVSVSVMFKPSQAVSSRRLESLAASIAQTVGLSLPPVNFYGIASRYLKQLSLPVEKILSHACRIYEWSMPPDLYLSINEFRLPTRVCVLSIVIVAIRILYNIHGFGSWEGTLLSHNSSSLASDPEEKLGPICNSDGRGDPEQGAGSSHNVDDMGTKPSRNSSHVMKSDFSAEELLKHLESKRNDIDDCYEYSKDLKTYLKFCKDVVFAGVELSSLDNEYKMIEEFWNFYENEKELPKDFEDQYKSSFTQRGSDDDIESLNRFSSQNDESTNKEGDCSPSNGDVHGIDSINGKCPSGRSLGDQNSNQTSDEALKDRAIRQMKADMEQNRFCYIPPRVNIKRLDYLHYVRKRDQGSLTYVAHADYYILLRSCAKVAQVDVRIMQMGVLNLEKRLAWLENRIDHCLHLHFPSITCEFCVDVSNEPEDVVSR